MIDNLKENKMEKNIPLCHSRLGSLGVFHKVNAFYLRKIILHIK